MHQVSFYVALIKLLLIIPISNKSSLFLENTNHRFNYKVSTESSCFIKQIKGYMPNYCFRILLCRVSILNSECIG